VVTNVEAAPNADASRVVPLLLAQVSAPVRWVESIRALAAAGVTRVVELGPGKVLGGLVKRISKDIEVLNVEDPASLEKSLGAAGRPLGHARGADKDGVHRKGGSGHRRLARHRAGRARSRSGRPGRRWCSPTPETRRPRPEAVASSGPNARSMKFDVSDTAACAAAVDEVVKGAGPAGRAGEQCRRGHRRAWRVRTKDDDWDRTLDTNLKGAFALCRAAARP
jgi:acyl transferase domain-containing protein